MPYHHLTPSERIQIQTYLRCGYSRSRIAHELGRPLCTICRELARNRAPDGRYGAAHAQGLAKERRNKTPNAPRLSHVPLRVYAEKKLALDWSPEQIAGRLPLDFPGQEKMRVCHETLYAYVYLEKHRGGTLYRHLRQGHKTRRKRLNSRDKRGLIKNRTGIEQRPALVAAQERIGDWEGDTVFGRRHKRPVATFVERKTGFTLLAPMPDKRAESLNDAAREAFCKLPPALRLTLTVDNGKEFAAHEKLARLLGAAIYFSRPYRANDRAINENTNGLLRQYLPKKTDFAKITTAQLKAIARKLNNRPRKKLGYLSPSEVFLRAVALQL